MAYAHNQIKQTEKVTVQSIRQLIPFFKQSHAQGFPLICVWWPKENGIETGKMFSGRRNAMGGDSHSLLSMEVMSAIDKALGEYLSAGTNSHRTLEQILKECPKRIVGVTNPGGTISLDPETGVLTEGYAVSLTAKPDGKSVFLKWSGPDGKVWGSKPDLIVTGSMPEGTYTAHFRAIADIMPPVPNPASTSICIKAEEPFTHSISVNDACLPVSFKTGKLPYGIKFNANLGVLYGAPRQIGTHTINITITGSDLNHTMVTNQVTLIVSPKTKSHAYRIKGNKARQKPR